jgi:hypothetical protein
VPTDVIIDPTSGQIYWNDSAGSPQSISIKGDAQNTISVVGYSGSFSPGSTPGGAATLASFNDNSGTSLFVPGTNGFDLGSSTLRWNTYATNLNLSSVLTSSSATISSSLLTGSARFNGGIAISGNASIGQSLLLYGAGTAYTSYTGFKAGSVTSNTLYTLPLTFPSTGNSILQSDTSGVMSWVPMVDNSGLIVAFGNLGDVQFNDGSDNFTSTANFNYNAGSSQLAISNYPLGGPSNTNAALQLLGITQFWTAGSDYGTFLAINAGTAFTGSLIDARKNDSYRFLVDANGSIRINFNSGTGWTLPTANGSSGQVLTANTNGIASWATVSSAGSGTVATPGSQYQVAGYYSGTGASVSGSTTFTNNTATGQVQILHTTASTSTSTGALQVAGGVGISGRLSFNQASFGTTGIATVPSMAMIGQTGDPIYMSILEDNSIAFEGSQGQLFSITPNLTSGYLWAVNDISGVPLLRANVNANVYIAEFGGFLGIGQTNPTYKLDLKGSFGLASSNDSTYNFIFSNSAASGSNSLQIRSANSILLYNSGNTFYTGFKSNAAANVTYTLPTTDGSSGQFLQTNGTGTLSWATATGSGGTGSTAGVGQGGQYEMAYYPGTGLSVIGSNTFTNNTATGVVSITHATVSTDFSNGALKVTGGVGIGGSLYVGGIGASITGVTFSNSTITRGTWNGTAISPTYGGTGLNNSSATGLLQYSSGTASVITTSAALASIISDETGTAGKLVFSTSPVFTTSVTTDSASFSVFNTTATTINAFGAATTLSIGAATGKATFNSTDDSSSTTSGTLAISGGAGIAKSVSIGGRLQIFNGASFTAFVSSASGNTVYTLPATSPATGSSVLQSTSAGVMSWVPLVSSSGSGLATTATNIYVNTLGNPNSFHSVLMTPVQSSSGSAVSSNGTVVYNPSTDILHTPGLAVTSGVDSSSTITGALQVRGGLGVTGTGYFDVVRTRAIVTTGDVTIAGNTALNGSTIDFGNAVTDSISFIGRVDTDIDPISNNTYDLGVPGLAYRNASFGGSVYFTNSSNTNIFALTAGATGSTLTYILPIDTPTAGQVLSASAPSAGVVTLSWEDDQTGAPAGGITTLNTLTAASQSFATGTSGTDFAISSTTSTHTFNIPDAGSSARGLVTTGTQTFAGAKTFSSALSVTNATVSTSTSTGALIVTGGVGIGGSLYTATGSSSSVSGVILANGNVSASTYNKLIFTQPATGATLTLANGSSLITSGGHSLTLNTTNTTSLTLPTTGTLATTSNKLSDFAATTSLELKNTISDETGSGALVFANTPSLVTPDIGVATATSVNKVTITAPATSATLTLSNGSSLITSGGHSLTFNTTNTTSLTLPTTGTLATTSNKLSDFAATTSLELKNTISDETGSGALVFATSPDFTTSVTTGSGTFSVFNATATNISAFGAATVMSIGASTGKATFNSTDNSTSTTTGGLVVSGGAGFAKSITVGGRLQMINGANYTAFVSSATSDIVYTLPPAAPAGVGSSYLSASTTGVMAWVAAPTSGGSATPGGSNKQIQYNSSNTFAGAAGFEYTTAGIANTVSIFSASGTGYTAGLWVHAINGATTRVGIGLSNPAFELEILGEISATNKSFVIDHPTKEGMKLRYGSLEGPENGVYVRGELKNSNIIEVPDHWLGLVHPDTYTVHLTPIGKYAQLYVEKIENYNVYVADANMNPIHCYYSVWAERKDIPKLITEYEAQ